MIQAGRPDKFRVFLVNFLFMIRCRNNTLCMYIQCRRFDTSLTHSAVCKHSCANLLIAWFGGLGVNNPGHPFAHATLAHKTSHESLAVSVLLFPHVERSYRLCGIELCF